MKLWPFVLKSTHAAVASENWFLRGTLKEANDEIRKHRLLLAALKDGDTRMTEALERSWADMRRKAESRA